MRVQACRARVHVGDCACPQREPAVFILGWSVFHSECGCWPEHEDCVPAGVRPCPVLGVCHGRLLAARADLCQLSEQLRDLSQLRLRGRPWDSAGLDTVDVLPASSLGGPLSLASPGWLREKVPRPRSWRYSLPCRAPKSRLRSSMLSPSCPGIPSSCVSSMPGKSGCSGLQAPPLLSVAEAAASGSKGWTHGLGSDPEGGLSSLLWAPGPATSSCGPQDPWLRFPGGPGGALVGQGPQGNRRMT